MKICPVCGHENKDDVTVCERDWCGHKFEREQKKTELDSGQDVNLRRELRPGTVFAGRYQVEKQLGQGGMGEVYLVRDQKLNDRETALKLTASSLTRDREARRRFIQEAAVILKQRGK